MVVRVRVVHRGQGRLRLVDRGRERRVRGRERLQAAAARGAESRDERVRLVELPPASEPRRVRVLERDDRVRVAPGRRRIDARVRRRRWSSASRASSWLREPVALFEIVSEEWLALTAVTVVPEGMPLPVIVEPTATPANDAHRADRLRAVGSCAGCASPCSSRSSCPCRRTGPRSSSACTSRGCACPGHPSRSFAGSNW